MKGGKSKAESKKGDSRLAVKKQTKKERQAAKDPNKPKRPPSAFFVFMSVDNIRKSWVDAWQLLTVESCYNSGIWADLLACKMEQLVNGRRKSFRRGHSDAQVRICSRNIESAIVCYIASEYQILENETNLSIYRVDFRKQYKEKHPNTKSVAVIGKAGGDKWKSMSEDEKVPFVEVAAQRKEEYERKMEAYNKKIGWGW